MSQLAALTGAHEDWPEAPAPLRCLSLTRMPLTLTPIVHHHPSLGINSGPLPLPVKTSLPGLT